MTGEERLNDHPFSAIEDWNMHKFFLLSVECNIQAYIFAYVRSPYKSIIGKYNR